MRHLLKLCYDGTNYHGWQIQPNAKTVQGVLNELLTEIFGTPIETTGCGRTDKGVHASMFYAHFDRDEILNERFLLRANHSLTSDIRLLDIKQVSDNFNARFDASERSYEYWVSLTPNPFLHKYALILYKTPDFKAMNKAAEKLLQYNSFGSFSKTGADNKTDFCKITVAEWKEHEGGLWKFHITSNRFLRGMVRAIVGTLLDVGFKKISDHDFIQIIESNNRKNAGESVDAHGLFLTDIQYPNTKLNFL